MVAPSPLPTRRTSRTFEMTEKRARSTRRRGGGPRTISTKYAHVRAFGCVPVHCCRERARARALTVQPAKRTRQRLAVLYRRRRRRHFPHHGRRPTKTESVRQSGFPRRLRFHGRLPVHVAVRTCSLRPSSRRCSVCVRARLRPVVAGAAIIRPFLAAAPSPGVLLPGFFDFPPRDAPEPYDRGHRYRRETVTITSHRRRQAFATIAAAAARPSVAESHGGLDTVTRRCRHELGAKSERRDRG